MSRTVGSARAACTQVTLLTLLLFGLGCRPPERTVSKLWGNRIVITRAVNPHAYEHVTRALLFEQAGAHDKAAAELQKALSYDDDSPELHARLAEIFLQLDRIEDADAEVARSVAIEPTVDGLRARAHVFSARGAETAAVVALREAAALAPPEDDAEIAETIHLELADAQIRALDIAAATTTLRELLTALPGRATPSLRLATVHWAVGALPEAEAALTDVIDAEPDDAEALLLRAALHTATGRPEPARGALQKALDRSDGRLDIATFFARWLVAQGEPKNAQALADELGRSAQDVEVLPERMVLEALVGRPARALALADEAGKGELDKDARARIAVARAAVLLQDRAQRDIDGAVKALLAVDKDAELFAESRTRAAATLRTYSRGPADLARARSILADLRKSGGDEDATVDVVIDQALLEEKAGDPTLALRLLDQIPGARRQDARVVLARAAVNDRRGDWRAALALGEDVLRRDAGNAEALNFWAFVAADHAHDLDRSIKRAQAALVLQPASAAILDTVGWGLLRKGDIARAGLYLHQAQRLEPEDAELLGHVATLYEAQNMRDQAIAALQRALTFEAEERVQKDLKQHLRRLDATHAAGR